MFTGIVAAVGQIETIERHAAGDRFGTRLTIAAHGLDLVDVKVGDSIMVQGACLTVTNLDARGFSVDVSAESLARTAGLDRCGPVNLEKAMRMGDRLDGHLVSGHVDGVGEVIHFAPVGESFELVVRASRELAPFLAYKGSVTVQGVSLTINDVEDHSSGCDFSINLIPHTLEVTTLKVLQVGERVNLEIDLIARYCERMLSYRTAP